MIISIIAAVAYNGVIGNNGKIPWNLPEEMAFFKRKTVGHPVIMGRKTFESLKKPLKDRYNVVITTNKNLLASASASNVKYVSNFTDAIDCVSSNEIFIIGGSQIYKHALDNDLVDKMYINVINDEYEGDAYFPTFDVAQWARQEIKETFFDFTPHVYIRNTNTI